MSPWKRLSKMQEKPGHAWSWENYIKRNLSWSIGEGLPHYALEICMGILNERSHDLKICSEKMSTWRCQLRSYSMMGKDYHEQINHLLTSENKQTRRWSSTNKLIHPWTHQRTFLEHINADFPFDGCLESILSLTPLDYWIGLSSALDLSKWILNCQIVQLGWKLTKLTY